jgi:RNA polymerase sigma-70 factor (sigma-E family)
MGPRPDRGAFEEFFVEIYPQAKRLAARIVESPAGAEDVAAEALARACLRWGAVRQLPHRNAWVLRVTTNLAVDSVRRRPRWLPGRNPAGPEVAGSDHIDLANALARLPKRQREVVTLRYLLDMSEEQVAETLGIARGTVKATSSQGLSALRARLGPDYQPAASATA